MEMVLLVGANPRNIKQGPRVRLHEGKWKLRIEGQKDSIMRLHLFNETDPIVTAPACNGDVHSVNEPSTAQIEFVNQGNEASISIFAELLT